MNSQESINERADTIISRFEGIGISRGVACQAAIIHIDGLIEIQKDYYGLVFTPRFRERINRKIEYLEFVRAEVIKIQSDMFKRSYKLLKPITDGKIGDTYFWNGLGYSNLDRTAKVLEEKYVENTPDMFERIPNMWDNHRKSTTPSSMKEE